ncbi:MAG: deoxyribonuclease V [Chloroflexi bacterium]|nr:deoxyribonuclease V [Chloroflexota bacterium]
MPETTTIVNARLLSARLRVSLPWPADFKQGVALQRDLASRVVEFGNVHAPYLAAGADMHIRRSDGMGIATVVTVSVPELYVVERVSAAVPVEFPYIPGLLSFRELPALLEAFIRLRTQPDVVLVDGHGRSHPRRFGLACHLGLELDLPTIGCAKSRLTGSFGDLGREPGSTADLELDGEIIGTALRSKERCNPLFVSVGHKISLQHAVKVVEQNLDGYKIPRALRLAHTAAKSNA